MAGKYLQDPYSAKIGATNIVRCTGFSFSETASLSPLAADNDRFTTAIAVGPASITTSLTAGARTSGMALVAGTKYATSGVVVTFKVPQGSTAKIVVANAVYGGVSGNVGHGNAGSFTYTCQHYSTSGSTSPITYTGT
jgi:hypothetical protein